MWYLLCCPSLHLFLTTMFKLILLLCYRHQKTKYNFCQIGNNWALTAAHCFFNQYTHQQDCFWHFQSFPNWTQCLGFVQGRFDGCAGCPRSQPCCHTGYSTFSKVPIGASTSCFWKKVNHFFLSSCAEGKLWADNLDPHFYRKVLKISELVLHPDYNQVPHPSQMATRHKRIWRNLTHRMYSGHQLF